MRKSHRKITVTRHQEHKEIKTTSSVFPIKMIANVKRTHSNAQHNMEQTQAALNNESTTIASVNH